jgi:hypothetical protein
MANRKSPAAAPAKKDAPPKRAAAPRKRTNAGVPPFEGHMQPDPSPEELWKQIAEAAYYKAKARHFAPGGEVQDWIEAEAEVMHRLGRAP